MIFLSGKCIAYLSFVIVFLFSEILFSQTIDSVHSYSNGKIHLLMGWDELKPYIESPPTEAPDIREFDIKSGFENNYLGLPINRVRAFFSSGRVTMITMNFPMWEDEYSIESKLSKFFGPRARKKEGDAIWGIEWDIGNNIVRFNGGNQLSQYYLELVCRYHCKSP